MPTDLQQRAFGATRISVSPIGLSASYYPGAKTIRTAIDLGINLFFAFGIDVQMTRTLRGITPSARDRLVIATGAYNYVWAAQNVRKAFEKRLRQFKTDYIDIFLFMGIMKPSEFRPEVEAELMKLKDEGKVRAIGVSGHDRKFLGTLASKGTLNALMLRYNAAHRGAESDIFPHLPEHNPGVISYTATRWTHLLRHPRGWPKTGRVPTAGECYRFVLSDPHVHVVLTAPRNERELRENVAAVQQGPLDANDMQFMREFGDTVHAQKKWFM